MSNHRKGSVEYIETQERQQRALALRATGATYLSIAEQLGYASGSGARKAVRTMLDRALIEGVDEYRMFHLMELNAMRYGVSAKARGLPAAEGELPPAFEDQVRAAQLVLKIQEREAALLGLDAPTRGITVDVTEMSDEELEAAYRQLRR